jgi:undecaprenyl diphosphate synthase
MSGLKEEIDIERLPSHIAVIMDGNGRWAEKRGGVRSLGHRNGAKAVKEITEACAEIGVKYLTVYAFSSENWNRPKDEVSGLMNLLVEYLEKEFNTLKKNGIRLSAIGDFSLLPDEVNGKLQNVINKTKDGERMVLNLALSYSGQWDIVQAAKAFAKDVKEEKLELHDLTAQRFKNYLSTKDIPDPELLIRTSGEIRLSNFLLYQMAYSELYFTDVLWPDFNKKELYRAILSYQNRERRFGKTSEQL